MKKIIVTTTINSPTEAIRKFDNMPNWKLIVVADKKTPKNYKLKNGIFLSTLDQMKIDKKLSNVIGWNCIERRNFGFILAKKLGAKIIATVDDDNIPYKFWGQNLLVGKTLNINYFQTKCEVFDPLYVTNYKYLWHRGFPLNLLDNRQAIFIGKKKIKVDIQADFWNGDPDIDALCRKMYSPNCMFKNNRFPFFSKKLSPFNSQNTFLDANLLKFYFMFPDQGRLHDIWASYYIQYKKKVNVIYNRASVYQQRNKHNIVKDFKEEFIGIKNTYKIISKMRSKKFKIEKEYSKRSIAAYNLYLKHFEK